MEDGIRDSSEDGGACVPLIRERIEAEGVSYDDARLNQLGYKQELSRSLSAISNFSVTFTIVSILTGLTTTFNTGLTYGGPVTMIWGWPIVGLLTLVVGLSMAEICSAYPTSGGLYFWSAKLCGNDWGPLASWLTGCGVSSTVLFIFEPSDHTSDGGSLLGNEWLSIIGCRDEI